jgi:hypothetical protein
LIIIDIAKTSDLFGLEIFGVDGFGLDLVNYLFGLDWIDWSGAPELQ